MALEAPSNIARVDFNRDDTSVVNLIPSALYSTSVPSAVVFFAVRRSFKISPPSTIASFALVSSIFIAAIFSRAVITGSSTAEPSRLSMWRVVVSRTMLVRISTISATDQLFSRNALSMSPGMKNEVRPSPPPTAISWLSDLIRSPVIIARSWSIVKSVLVFSLFGKAVPAEGP